MVSRLPRVRFGECGEACPRNRKRDTEQPSRDGVAAHVINTRFYRVSLLIREQVRIEGCRNGGDVLEVFEGVEPP